MSKYEPSPGLTDLVDRRVRRGFLASDLATRPGGQGVENRVHRGRLHDLGHARNFGSR